MSSTHAWTEKTLKEILEGKKPFIDVNEPREKWLYDFAENMHQRLFLLEEPFCHFTTENDTEEALEYKGDTSVHGMSYQMVVQEKAYQDIVGDSYFHFFATDLKTRQEPFKSYNIEFSAPVVFPAEGDFITLAQMHSYLRSMLDTNTLSLKPVFPETLIDNSKGIWTEFLENTFSKTERKKLEEMGVKTLSNEKAVQENLQRLASKYTGIKKDMLIKPGSIGLFFTSNSKKVHEFGECLEARGAQFMTVPQTLVSDRAEEAEEKQKTYLGNNSEKGDLATKSLKNMDADSLKSGLRRYGVKAEDAWLIVDDRGLEFEYDFFSGPEFEGYTQYLNPYRSGPGVELAQVLKGMSLVEFYDRIYKAADRMGIDGPIKVKDIVAYQLRPIDNNGLDEAINVFAAMETELSRNPFIPEDGIVYSENYLIELTDPERRTKSEIPNFLIECSTHARAIEALMAVTGMDRHQIQNEITLFSDFNVNVQERNYVVHEQNPVLGFRNQNEENSQGDSALSEEFSEVVDFDAYDFTSGPYAFTLSRADGSKVVYPSTLNKITHFIESADAFCFDERAKAHSDFEQSKQYIYELYAGLSILTVANQIFDPTVFNKACLINSEKNPELLAILKDLHIQGLVGDKLEHLMDQYSTEEEKEAILERKQKGYVRISPAEDMFRESGEDKNDIFKVAIYSSATNTDPDKRDRAYDLAYDLCREGIGIINGGGSKGLMERTSDAVIDFRKNQLKGVEDASIETHLKLVQCEETYRAEGVYEGADRLVVMPNIYLRMDELQKVDAEIVLDGGAGSVQEIVASMINRINNRTVSKDRPLIIVNSLAYEGHQNERIYDEFLKYMPKDIMRACNVRVVNTIEDAKKLVIEARQNIGMSPREHIISPLQEYKAA